MYTVTHIYYRKQIHFLSVYQSCDKLTWVWVYSCAVKEQCGGSIAEWTIYDIAVTSNPSNVSNTGKNLTRLIVKIVLQVR